MRQKLHDFSRDFCRDFCRFTSFGPKLVDWRVESLFTRCLQKYYKIEK